jgi:hypothetical protein
MEQALVLGMQLAMEYLQLVVGFGRPGLHCLRILLF